MPDEDVTLRIAPLFMQLSRICQQQAADEFERMKSSSDIQIKTAKVHAGEDDPGRSTFALASPAKAAPCQAESEHVRARSTAVK